MLAVMGWLALSASVTCESGPFNAAQFVSGDSYVVANSARITLMPQNRSYEHWLDASYMRVSRDGQRILIGDRRVAKLLRANDLKLLETLRTPSAWFEGNALRVARMDRSLPRKPFHVDWSLPFKDCVLAAVSPEGLGVAVREWPPRTEKFEVYLGSAASPRKWRRLGVYDDRGIHEAGAGLFSDGHEIWFLMGDEASHDTLGRLYRLSNRRLRSEALKPRQGPERATHFSGLFSWQGGIGASQYSFGDLPDGSAERLYDLIPNLQTGKRWPLPHGARRAFLNPRGDRVLLYFDATNTWSARPMKQIWKDWPGPSGK